MNTERATGQPTREIEPPADRPPRQPAVQTGTTAGLAPSPLKPNVVDSPGRREPFHAAFRAVTRVPLVAISAFQASATRCAEVHPQETVQPLRAEAPLAATVTSAWKPPGHCPATR